MPRVTEDGALALYIGVAAQAARDVRGTAHATETDKHTAWEFLRRTLDRGERLRLLRQAEEKRSAQWASRERKKRQGI